MVEYRLTADDRVPLYTEVNAPHADTLKKLRRWWRESEHKNKKLINGTRLTKETDVAIG